MGSHSCSLSKYGVSSMVRKVKITAKESVDARTSKDQFILRQSKIQEQSNRDVETARAIFGDPKLGGVTQQEKIRTVGDLETGFQNVENVGELPRIRDPQETAERFFEARQEADRGKRDAAIKASGGTPVGGEETGLGSRPQELIGELQEKIDQPPEIQGTISEQNLEIQVKQREFFGKLFTGKASIAEIINEAKNFGTGLAITGGLAAGLTLAAPLAASAAVKAVIGSKVGASVVALSSSVGLYFIGGSLTDLNRGEIQTSRKIIGGMVEEGERIEADVRNGLDPSFAVNRLEEMANEIDKAEAGIKLATIHNAKYKFDKESLADQQDVVKAREAVRRRLRAVDNIAKLGTAALNPEALIQSIAER